MYTILKVLIVLVVSTIQWYLILSTRLSGTQDSRMHTDGMGYIVPQPLCMLVTSYAMRYDVAGVASTTHGGTCYIQIVPSIWSLSSTATASIDSG